MATHTHTHSHPHTHFGDLNQQNTGRLALSLFLTLAFVFIEAAAGWWSNSLALLTDAAHNLTDVIALGLSWYALRLTIKPSNSKQTFGYHRAGILVALLNSATLVLISIGVFVEAYRRFNEPPEVKSGVLIGVGLIAFIINAVTAWLVKDGSEHDLNMRSAFIHLMGDVLSTIGAVIAGIIIYFTGANWLDPVVSVFIGILILFNAATIIRESIHILLEGTPRDVDMAALIAAIKEVNGVQGVHDLHVWSLTQDLRAMSAHILTHDVSISTGAAIQRDVNTLLRERYHIGHTTLQLECEGCEPDVLYCDIQEANHTH
jgi:cobalt-zinc-cadmium efflux system protein